MEGKRLRQPTRDWDGAVSHRKAQRTEEVENIHSAPTFYPTVEEWKDPCAYIASIRPRAEKFGICKVVPPAGWSLPCTLPLREAGGPGEHLRYITRQQNLHQLLDGQAFPDGPELSFEDFRSMADKLKAERFPQLVPPELREAYGLTSPAAAGLAAEKEGAGTSMKQEGAGAGVQPEGISVAGLGVEPPSRQASSGSTFSSGSLALPAQQSWESSATAGNAMQRLADARLQASAAGSFSVSANASTAPSLTSSAATTPSRLGLSSRQGSDGSFAGAGAGGAGAAGSSGSSPLHAHASFGRLAASLPHYPPAGSSLREARSADMLRKHFPGPLQDASPFARKAAEVEAAYWRLVESENGSQPFTVLYGNDQDTRAVGSGFPCTEGPFAVSRQAEGGAAAGSREGEQGAALPAAANTVSNSASAAPASHLGNTDNGVAIAAARHAANMEAAVAAGTVAAAGAAAPAAGGGGAASPASASIMGTGTDAAGAAAGGGAAGELQEGESSPSLASADPPINFSDPAYYLQTGWNLNNLPFLSKSVLRHVNEEINGINVPWLYLGSIFTTFAWHNEDHFLYSLNYMHYGEGKSWYGVPGARAGDFEGALLDMVQERKQAMRMRRAEGEEEEEAEAAAAAEEGEEDFSPPSPSAASATSAASARASLLLYGITYMMPPFFLARRKVPVYRLFQQPGDFVITFPEAYHAGFSHGFNIAEACNFALSDWLPYGRRAVERYRSSKLTRRLCFSHEQLLCNLARQSSRQDYCSSMEACGSILEELRSMLVGEKREREACAAAGLSKQVALSRESDPRYECLHCGQICYLSAVICRCPGSRGKVACLRHAGHLCGSAGSAGCDMESKVLVHWYSLDKLGELLQLVTDRWIRHQAIAAKARLASRPLAAMGPAGTAAAAGASATVAVSYGERE